MVKERMSTMYSSLWPGDTICPRKPHQFTYFLVVLSRFDISVLFVVNHIVSGVLSETDAGGRRSKAGTILK
jgi:hypothetical protein